MEVHKVLGPGFLEAVYQTALEDELALRQIPYESQKRLPVFYKGRLIGDYVADLVVDNKNCIGDKSCFCFKQGA